MKYETIRKPMVLDREKLIYLLLICTLLLEAEFVDDPLLI